jgi:hypothetical protein
MWNGSNTYKHNLLLLWDISFYVINIMPKNKGENCM